LSSRRQHCVYFAQTPELTTDFLHISAHLFSFQQSAAIQSNDWQTSINSLKGGREGKSLDIQHHSEPHPNMVCLMKQRSHFCTDSSKKTDNKSVACTLHANVRKRNPFEGNRTEQPRKGARNHFTILR
jgi:hypothetical protein